MKIYNVQDAAPSIAVRLYDFSHLKNVGTQAAYWNMPTVRRSVAKRLQRFN
jgi:hypothetical protein